VKPPRRIAIVLLAFGLTATIGSGAATATPTVARQDTASTEAFIASAERYDVLEARRIPAINALQNAYLAHVSSACPRALAGAPALGSSAQRVALIEFRAEAGAALEIDALQPIRGITHRIAELQERLRFSDPALQFEVGFYASATPAYLALRPPDLCADARALAASDFTRLTPAGNAFWRDVSTVLVPASAPSTTLLGQMRAYAPTAVAAALKRLPVLQRRFDQPLAIGTHLQALLRSVFGTSSDQSAIARRLGAL
jgi:hypothetical protein